MASSGNFVGEKELATLDAPKAGTYVLRVINFASVSPAWPDGTVLQTVPVVVDRGQRVKPDLALCRERY